jgi:hypothetical protein
MTKPLVRRTVNLGGGFERIGTNAETPLRSKEVHAAMLFSFRTRLW